MNSTTRNRHFVPKSCHRAPQDSVTLGAGVLWDQAYRFAAAEQNITLVGGAGTVGAAGGWILASDISTNASAFDLLQQMLSLLLGWRAFPPISQFRTWRRQSSRNGNCYA